MDYNYQNANSGKEFMKFIHSIPEKKNRIRDYCDGSKEKLLAKKNRYINERNNLETANYYEIANEMKIEYSKEFSGEQYDIAKFFWKKDYIDGTYQNYISYFRHGKLTIDENNFILLVKNGKSVSRASVDIINWQKELYDNKVSVVYINKIRPILHNFFHIYVIIMDWKLIRFLWLQDWRTMPLMKKWPFGIDELLADTTITSRKNNYCSEADVNQIRIHDFRHSNVSLLISLGVPLN